MTGGEIALIITAILGGLTGVGALIKTLIDSRVVSKKSDLDNLRGVIEMQHNADKAIIESLRCQVEFQGAQINELKRENNLLHDTDNTLRIELAAEREASRKLRIRVEEQSKQITELQAENADLKSKNAFQGAALQEMRDKLEEYKSGRKKQTGSLSGGV